ncbi:MAG: zf-HC2 domain-containing protein [Planctomycetes bacterium]|nr:zf-HC2 domain-containing protein [Planctomycetota bacterium]
MTTLRCEQARAMLMAYLDSELDANATLSVTEHLKGCAGCRERFEREGRLEQALVATLREETMPADVRARVLDALPGHAPRRMRRRPRPRLPVRREALAFAAAAVLLVAAGLYLYPFGRVDGPPLALRATASHRAAFASSDGLVPPERVDALLRGAGFGELPIAHGGFVNGHMVELLGARREDLAGVPVIHLVYECCDVPASVFLMRRADFEELPVGLRPVLVEGASLDEVDDLLDVRFARRGDLVLAAVGDGHHLEPASPLL